MTEGVWVRSLLVATEKAPDGVSRHHLDHGDEQGEALGEGQREPEYQQGAAIDRVVADHAHGKNDRERDTPVERL